MLGGLLAAQLYIVFVRELPVPQFVQRRLDARLEEIGLAAKFRRAQFDPAGRMLAEDVEIRSTRFEDPLLLAGQVFASKSIWSILSGEREPDELRIERGTLRLPAQLSPTGIAAPFVQDLAATLRFDDSLLQIDQLAFRIGQLRVTARGEFQLPAPGGERAPVQALVDRVLQAARQLARELPQLEALDSPSLHADLRVRPGIGNVAELRLLTNGVQGPSRVPVQIGPLLACTTVRLDGVGARPLRIEFATPSILWPERANIEKLQGVATLEFDPQATPVVRRVKLEAGAGRVNAWDEIAIGPSLALEWIPDQPAAFALATWLHDEPFAVHGTADLSAQKLAARFSGRVAPELVTNVLTKHAPQVAPYLQFGDPVEVLRGDLVFDPGWRFAGLQTRVRAGRLNSNNVRITSARGRIDLDAQGNFLAHDAAVVAERNHARGSYWMNFRTFDFRVLLTGALNPPHIAGWFRRGWWGKFWQNFEFGPPPVADVDVIGCFRAGERTSYFGVTEATAATVLGADFEQAHARVFVRPHFAHAFDLRVTRAGGEQQAHGWFKRYADPVTHDVRRFEYDLAGTLEPVTLRRLGGPVAETLLEPWVFGRPPSIEFRGYTNHGEDNAGSEIEFAGRAAGGFSYEGFPLELLEVKGRSTGSRVQLDDIKLGVAGGRGSAKATLDGTDARRRLEFDFQLADADLVRAIGALSEFERARRGDGAPPSPNRELLKRATGGKLQLTLTAAGQPQDIASFGGQGRVEVTGAELGEIHLFGLLSQVLSGLSLSFSSLKLDTMRGNFVLERGQVTFPDLRVSGATAVIEAKGDYRLVDQTLDFSARLKPYEENRNLFTAAIGIVINPLTSILELRLTGPIQKPTWSISLGGNTPLREAPAENPPPDIAEEPVR